MLTTDEKEMIWKLRDEGASITEISNITHHDRHTVSKELNNKPPSLTNSSVSIKEVDEVQKYRGKIKSSMPALSALLNSDEEVAREAARNGIYHLNKEERKLMDAIKSFDTPKEFSRTDKLKLLNNLVQGAETEWSNENGQIKLEDLKYNILQTMSLQSMVKQNELDKETIEKLIDLLGELYIVNMKDSDYQTLISFLSGLREGGISLTDF